MSNIANYKQLKEEFGKYSSFAIWADEGATPTSNTEDMSVMTDKNILALANTDFVFVGLNAAEHTGPERVEAWSNFHSADRKKQRDHKLRYAFAKTRYWGSYITDIIKGYRETDSKAVMKYVKENPEEYAAHIERFCREIHLLAGDKKPILVAMGNSTYDLLLPLAEKFTIKKIPHYSAQYKYSNRDYYRNAVLEILDNLK